ncbi:RimK family alpha-L-glutamate ligase [Heliorestis acidaminivorans]|uniref:RimK family alpha-L-glutamate ligase n=2 Tax=Heliorestis acidaminivorans TaxID=553427 RepID=A0A6I0ET61_9FIRM|nr:RimK family alpha-L-glutamate ligase [Heliorestis acidaminivorans]
MEIINWLHNCACQYGLETELVRNNDLIVTIDNGSSKLIGKYGQSKPDFVLFWDKDITLARHLEQMGMRLFNRAETIAICDNKALTVQCLAGKNIAMPKTIVGPLVFQELEAWEHLEVIAEELCFPLVLKECYGSFGQQVYLIHNYAELLNKVKELKNVPYLFQELVQSSYGQDVRLQVVGDKVVAAMLRKSDHDFRANVTNGAKMFPYEPTEEEIALAIKCSQLVGADFSAVDLLFGPQGEPLLCEVNSNGHFKNIYDCTGVDVAKAIMEHILVDLGI